MAGTLNDAWEEFFKYNRELGKSYQREYRERFHCKDDYTDGYRAGVEAMREAMKREGMEVGPHSVDDHIDEIASRLLEEKP